MASGILRGSPDRTGRGGSRPDIYQGVPAGEETKTGRSSGHQERRGAEDRKNIGRIFRRHNIVEYKSPKDSLSVDDFYKVYGYACFYKSDVKTAESVDIEEQAERLVKEYWNHKDNTLYQAVMDIIIRANRKQFEEAKNMCDALRELFAEELKENYQAGEDQGRRELSRLILKLSELGRTDEIIKAAESPEYQEKLMKELGVSK